MPEIRIHIRLSPSEWRKMDSVIKKQLGGKRISEKHSSISWFITTGINQEFSKKNQMPCTEKKEKKVRKFNRISVSEDIFEEMMCQASEASISPSELVKRRLFDVHLLPPKTIE